MLSKEILIRRLSIVKMLFKMGVDYSNYGDTYRGLSILSFHDSIEFFLNLILENSQKFKKDKIQHKIFETVLTLHPELTLRDSILALNTARNNLKHNSFLPSKEDSIKFRRITEDFFNQNTPTQFNLEFDAISLSSLIDDKQVRKYVEQSEKFLDKNGVLECIEQIAFAFNELIYNYEKSKMSNYESPFNFSDLLIKQALTPKESKIFGNENGYINKRFRNIEKSLKIITLGIDYRKYSKFILLTPVVTRISDNLIAELTRNVKFTKENCRYCIDFVIETALHIQEFEFNDDDLYDSTTIIQLSSCGGNA